MATPPRLQPRHAKHAITFCRLPSPVMLLKETPGFPESISGFRSNGRAATTGDPASLIAPMLQAFFPSSHAPTAGWVGKMLLQLPSYRRSFTSIITTLLPRMTCIHHIVISRLKLLRSVDLLRKRDSTYHHANIRLHLVIDSIVQHQIHKLVEST